jgi:hypothetical protein
MGLGLLVSSTLHGHTHLRHTTVGRTPLDEGPARRRDLYLTTHNNHKTQTSMPPVWFEPTILVSEWPKTHALDRTRLYIALSKWIIWKDVSRSGPVWIWGTISELPLSNRGKPWKIPVRIVSVMAKIRTRHLPNASHKCYNLSHYTKYILLSQNLILLFQKCFC